MHGRLIRTRPLGIGTALLAAGCLTGAQTMEQDLALQRWKRCDTFSTIVLQRINLDGRVIVSGRGPEDNAFLGCMEFAPSFGDVATTWTYPARTSHRRVSDEVKAEMGIGPGLIRLSVGLEKVDDLIADLEEALR